MDGFGTSFPDVFNISSIFPTIDLEFDAILPNTEAKFDSKLMGLEFIMANAGNVEFYVNLVIKHSWIIGLLINFKI